MDGIDSDLNPRVRISQANTAQAPLLRTCNQIRPEVSSIDHLENSFDVLCPGFDPTNMIALARHREGHKISTEVHDYEVGPKWANAFTRLKAYHNDQVGRLDEVYDPGADQELWNSVTKVFCMVDVIKRNGMRWKEVKTVLVLSKDLAALSVEWEWAD